MTLSSLAKFDAEEAEVVPNWTNSTRMRSADWRNSKM